MTSENNTISKQLDQQKMPAPVWQHNDTQFLLHLVRAANRETKGIILRYIRFRGNKIAYLKHLGVRIGTNCDILTTVKNFGTEPWLIEIGDRVTIAGGVVLLTHDGANRVFRHLIPGSSAWGNRFGRIKIGDNCFIGVNSIVMPGVEIGRDSIVGVGSVVNHDVQPRMVVAGVPAREICTLDEYVERYKQKMVPISDTNRDELRQELTTYFWGERR